MVAAGAGAVAIASFNGTIELLVLASGGAFLAHRGILTGRAVYAFSQTLIQLLIPCLMYYSIVDGLQALKQHFSMSNLAEIVFPPFLCVITLAIGWAAAVPCVWLLGRGKDECVRRGIIVCIMVGNGRSFPLLILSALCDNFGPFRADGRCIGRSAQIVSLYTMVWQIMLWVPIFAYLINAPAAAEDLQDEEAPLVSTESAANRPGWLSTITLSVVAAVVTMLVSCQTSSHSQSFLAMPFSFF